MSLGTAKFIVGIFVITSMVVFILLDHYQKKEEDLEKKIRSQQAKILLHQDKEKVKEFEGEQKAKREVLEKQLKVKDKNESEINTSIGVHYISF
ncbi:MAG: hypothetical protein C6I01_01925 [Epsilonproteobacteria bacterium]|nr:hypothetical protein [Campylobacterota bacterium]